MCIFYIIYKLNLWFSELSEIENNNKTLLIGSVLYIFSFVIIKNIYLKNNINIENYLSILFLLFTLFLSDIVIINYIYKNKDTIIL